MHPLISEAAKWKIESYMKQSVYLQFFPKIFPIHQTLPTNLYNINHTMCTRCYIHVSVNKNLLKQ
jgi:hypothetical protein